MSLFDALDNGTFTQNGRNAYKSTMHPVLDFFANAPAMRGGDVTTLFAKALAYDEQLAMRALFYVRDVRGGGRVGEREVFRQGLRYLFSNRYDLFQKVVHLVPEYGRWDDLLEYVDCNVVRMLVINQFHADLHAIDSHSDHVSLLGKWLPSVNASSKKTRALAKQWAKVLQLRESDYRKALSKLRGSIDVVERKMSAKAWNDIRFEAVPSLAMKNYRKAFGKHAASAFAEYMRAVESGDKKINSATLYPYDIVRAYTANYLEHDRVLEAQWNALPNYLSTDKRVLTVVDVSGSMNSGLSSVPPIAVSVSLGIYFAERMTGPFANKFITFSENPTVETLVGDTLAQKIYNLKRANWGYNTDIDAVFDLILRTARNYDLPEKDMPEVVMIISDMQFDENKNTDAAHLESLKQQFAQYGYTMPQIVYWNVSHKGGMPAKKNDRGVVLVAGASPAVFQSVVRSIDLDPFESMVEALSDQRYDAVGFAVYG
jgi:hypothetical protein